MRFIFIVLFLVSFGSVSLGGVGEVYYCATEHAYYLQTDGVEKIDKQRFEFKYDDQFIDFGSKSTFFAPEAK